MLHLKLPVKNALPESTWARLATALHLIAYRVRKASIHHRQDRPLSRRVLRVPRTRTPGWAATTSSAASATGATADRMGRLAVRVPLGRTRM